MARDKKKENKIDREEQINHVNFLNLDNYGHTIYRCQPFRKNTLKKDINYLCL